MLHFMSFFVGFNFKRKRPQMYEFIQSAFASLQHTLYLRPAQAEWEQGLPRPTSCASLPRAQWAQAIGRFLPFLVVETFHLFLNCAGDAWFPARSAELEASGQLDSQGLP